MTTRSRALRQGRRAPAAPATGPPADYSLERTCQQAPATGRSRTPEGRRPGRTRRHRRMDTKHTDRRTFLKSSLSTAAIAAAPLVLTARRGDAAQAQAATAQPAGEPRIRFAAIGMNHGHINGMCDAAHPRRRRAGQLLRQGAGPRRGVRQALSRRRCSPRASRRSSTTSGSPLVASAAIASERAPLGIRVMKAGKDFLSDKPAMTTLAQLAEVRKVQAADQADLLGDVQRAAREPRHREGRAISCRPAPSAR